MAVWLKHTFLFCFLITGEAVDIATENSYTADDGLLKEIREFVEHTMACRNAPGLTLSVTRWNETVMVEGYGRRGVTLPSQHPQANVTGHSKFMLGSLSKAFTATLLGKLIGELKGSDRFPFEVTWNTPIHQILGDGFRLYDDVRTNKTTLKDLLGHRLGYPTYYWPQTVGLDTSHSRQEYCRRMFMFKPVTEFRDRFYYNDHMYTLAGCVAEVLGGDIYEKLVEKHLFGPLKMTDSGISDSKIKMSTETFALPYVLNKNVSGFVELDPLTLGNYPTEPATAVYSTGEDMSSWMKMLVAEGRWNGEQLVDRTQLLQTWTPTMALAWPYPVTNLPMFPFSGGNANYGFGWNLGTYNGFRRYQHRGSISGYQNLISLLPDTGLGIFAAMNSGWHPDASTALDLIHAYVTDRLLGNAPWLNLTTACTYPRPWFSWSLNLKSTRKSADDRQLEVDDVALSERLPNQGVKTPPAPKISERFTEFNEYSAETDASYNGYIGRYGHLLFGNATVFYNATTDELRIFVGRFGTGVLERVEGQGHTFNVYFHGPASYIHGTGRSALRKMPLYFRSMVDGNFQELVFTSFEPRAPPVYVRNRKWTDVNDPSINNPAFRPFSNKELLMVSIIFISIHIFSV